MVDQKYLNTLVKAAGWGLIGLMFSKVVSYLYRLVVARYMGPDVYGTLQLGIVALSFVGTVTVFSLSPAIKTFVPKHVREDDWAAVRGTVLSALAITGTLSILGAALMYLGAGLIANRIFQAPQLTPVIQIFAFVVPFSNLSTVVYSTIKGFKEVKYNVFLVTVLTSSVQLVATVILMLVGLDLLAAVYGWAAGVIIPLFIGIYILEKKIEPVFTRNVKPDMNFRELTSYSYPLLLSGMIGELLGWADTFLIGYFMNETEVGFYNAALPTAAILMIPQKALGQLTLESMSEKAHDREALSDTLKTLTRWNTAVVLPMFLLMALFSREVIPLLFGKEYLSAAAALAILSFGKLYSASVGYIGDMLKAIEETQIFWKNSVLSLALNLGLNSILIPGLKINGSFIVPELGITGAAIATTSSIIIMQTVLLAEAYYYKGIIPFNRKTWKPVAASLAALAFTYTAIQLLFPSTTPLWVLVPGAAAFGLSYAFAFLLLGGIEEEDRNLMLDAAGRIGRREDARRTVDRLEKLALL
ncbi:MAG: flippase [Candidatus Nanohaloarchaea archaeon]